ncbi:hypothetical protein JWG45_06470 [Leptospira sp. 201903070]|uniref:Uncharacterized protein n=1 Tax=Leptospira ainlahdjerensis TaxID=2810033 RepID=A0ABS2U8U2_9LEPT|nr:hypothetical protein [Leptospira ainlahdjerensis]MBM9576796.1 hypothetical protein [Leptospira ainlahdjerensis]
MSEVGIRLIETEFVKGRKQPVDIYEVYESGLEEFREFKFKDVFSEELYECKVGEFCQASMNFD